MAFKFLVFAAVLAVSRAGVLDYSHGYDAAPAPTYHRTVTQHNVGHAAPVNYHRPAPVAYAAAPAAHYSHAAPAARYDSPAHYGAPAVQYDAPAHYAAPNAKAVVAEPRAPAQYDFEYSVQDPHTGDVKSQKEVRHGDAVRGSYSLIEADGSKRTVEYTADAHNGFNAVVHHEPAAHPVAVKAAPVAVKYAAPGAEYSHGAQADYSHGAQSGYSHAAHGVYRHTEPAATYSSYSAPNHYYHH